MSVTELYSCPSDNGVMISFNFTFSYASNTSGTWSDLSVTLLDDDYSFNGSFWLKIDCDDSGNAKHLNVTGMNKEESAAFKKVMA